jgi:hypothetical protein
LGAFDSAIPRFESWRPAIIGGRFSEIRAECRHSSDASGSPRVGFGFVVAILGLCLREIADILIGALTNRVRGEG